MQDKNIDFPPNYSYIHTNNLNKMDLFFIDYFLYFKNVTNYNGYTNSKIITNYLQGHFIFF